MSELSWPEVVPSDVDENMAIVMATKAEDVLSGLDPEQSVAVTADAGPVCILAGAGTGKTRAVTHRIAYRVRRGDLRGQHVLAVTFTARAAGELRDRLRALGVGGVSARTFHSAALRQLRFFERRAFEGRQMPELLDSTLKFVGIAAARAGVQADGTKRRDLAVELEWAASVLASPDDYASALNRSGRIPPMDPSSIAKVYAAYIEAKRRAGVMDFSDMLSYTINAIESFEDISEQVRSQYRFFVVDEFQDVNPLQQRLLDAWMGERDDLTVVGDASQTIYTFNGATSRYLIGFGRRFPDATMVRLVRDYRSTPQVVGLANNVIAEATSDESALGLTLVGQQPAGPAPVFRTYPDETAEAVDVARQCADLIADGIPAKDIAVLYRTNAQSQAYESALADHGVPTVVAGAERFFHRAEVRAAIMALRKATHTDTHEGSLENTVAVALEAVGWRIDSPPDGGIARERWEAVAALAQLAADHKSLSLAEFVDELGRRAAAQHSPQVDAVTLGSLHTAKGLEWHAVFLVGLAEGTLPTSRARTAEQREEERRLLYVGITRAKRLLYLSYGLARSVGGRQREACSFLIDHGFSGTKREKATAKPGQNKKRSRTKRQACRVCGETLSEGVTRKLGRCADCPSSMDEALFDRLREWRKTTAEEAGVPAYVVFTDVTLTAIAERMPKSDAELVSIAGIGPRKLQLYGAAVLDLVSNGDA